jgi:hypothetical protein
MANVCAFAAGGARFALLDDGRLRILACETGVTLCVCVEPRHLASQYTCMAWAPREKASLLALGTDNGALLVWDVVQAQLVLETKPTGARIASVHWMAQDRVLVVGAQGAQLWELSNQCVAHWGQGGALLSVTAVGQAECVVGSNVIQLKDVMNGNTLREWKGGHTAPITLLDMNKSVVVSGTGDRVVGVWRQDMLDRPSALLAGAAALQRFHVHEDDERVLAVSQDGSEIYLWYSLGAGTAAQPSGSGRKGSQKGQAASAVAPEHSLLCGNHPCLDACWMGEDVLVARLHSGRVVFSRASRGEQLPPLGEQSLCCLFCPPSDERNTSRRQQGRSVYSWACARSSSIRTELWCGRCLLSAAWRSSHQGYWLCAAPGPHHQRR